MFQVLSHFERCPGFDKKRYVKKIAGGVTGLLPTTTTTTTKTTTTTTTTTKQHYYMFKGSELTTRPYNLSLVVRKPVFGVSDQVRHKPECAATEDG